MKKKNNISGTGSAQAEVQTPQGLTISQAVDGIGQTMTQVTGLVVLTPAAKKLVLKMRKGGGQLVTLLAQTAEANPSLVPARINPALMEQRLAEAAQVGPLRTALANALQSVDDTIFQLNGESWKDALGVYAALQQVAGTNPEVKDAVDAMTAFLAVGPRKPATEPGVPTTPVTAPPDTGAGGSSTPSTPGSGTSPTVPVYTPTPKS